MKYLLPHHIIICIIANYKKFLRLHPGLSSGGFTCIWSQLVVLDSIQIIAETIGNIHHRRLSRCNHSRPKHTINNNEFLMHLSLSLCISLLSLSLFFYHTQQTHTMEPSFLICYLLRRTSLLSTLICNYFQRHLHVFVVAG